RKLNLSWLCGLLAAAPVLAAAEKATDKALPVRGFCIPSPSPSPPLPGPISEIESVLALRAACRSTGPGSGGEGDGQGITRARFLHSFTVAFSAAARTDIGN